MADTDDLDLFQQFKGKPMYEHPWWDLQPYFPELTWDYYQTWIRENDYPGRGFKASDPSMYPELFFRMVADLNSAPRTAASVSSPQRDGGSPWKSTKQWRADKRNSRKEQKYVRYGKGSRGGPGHGSYYYRQKKKKKEEARQAKGRAFRMKIRALVIDLNRKGLLENKELEERIARDTEKAAAAAKHYYENDEWGKKEWKWYQDALLKKELDVPWMGDRSEATEEYNIISLFVKHSRSLGSAKRHFIGSGRRHVIQHLEKGTVWGCKKPLPKFKWDWEFEPKVTSYSCRMTSSKAPFLGSWSSVPGLDLHSGYMDDPHPDEYIPGYTEFHISTVKYESEKELSELDR